MASDNSNFVLLAVATSGIQSYIFGSNRLKENIGASYLVKQATEDWAFKVLKKVAASSHNLTQDNTLDATKTIIESNLEAEVVYAGGGNLITLFRTAEIAKAFTRELSTKVLLEAPLLRLDIHQESFTWKQDGTELAQAIKDLLETMKKARSAKPSSSPLLGLGVSVMCRSTALPAVAVKKYPNEDEQYISAEIAAKIDAVEKTNQWLNKELSPGNNYTYPLDLDELGRSRGEQSYIAVVHADGNGMGAFISKIGEKASNRQYITGMRQFSEQVRIISRKAMQAVINCLQKNIIFDGQEEDAGEVPQIPGTNSIATLELAKAESGKYYLPIRPLVFGGDDTTFVCDGRLGLSLATTYLEAFQKAAKEEKLELSACAGVTIIKTHYPFARAYQLAEELCSEAKKFRRENFSKSGGALDWHFTTTGVYGELQFIREREYKVPAGSLTLRPVSLGKESKENLVSVRNWPALQQVTKQFETEWADKRNKSKALRDALRSGPEAVRQFLTIYGAKLPDYSNFTENGWSEKSCGYFDALELMDIHLDLAR